MAHLAISHAVAGVSSVAFMPTSVHKRAVNLSLNDAVVTNAKWFTPNLSATVDALLVDYVAAQQSAQVARQQQANAWCAEWNAVNAEVGSFADAHSTL